MRDSNSRGVAPNTLSKCAPQRSCQAGAAGSLWDVVRDRRLSPRLEVIGGVLEDESAGLLREFFGRLRQDDPYGPGGST